MIVTYVCGELMMVCRTTAQRINPGEKANLSTEELQSTKGGNVLPHEATLVMSGNSVISDLNSMSKYFEHADSCLKEKRR